MELIDSPFEGWNVLRHFFPWNALAFQLLLLIENFIFALPKLFSFHAGWRPRPEWPRGARGSRQSRQWCRAWCTSPTRARWSARRCRRWCGRPRDQEDSRNCGRQFRMLLENKDWLFWAKLMKTFYPVLSWQGFHLAYKKAKSTKFCIFKNCLPEMKPFWILKKIVALRGLFWKNLCKFSSKLWPFFIFEVLTFFETSYSQISPFKFFLDMTTLCQDFNLLTKKLLIFRCPFPQKIENKLNPITWNHTRG